MRRGHQQNQKPSLQLGFHKQDPKNFYQTSNKQYYTNEAVNTQRSPNAGPGQNFKSKVSKDNLVFGDYKVDYNTENKLNFVEYPEEDVAKGVNHLNRIPDKGRELLSFGQKDNYTSSYGQVYNQRESEDLQNDALGAFMESQEQARLTKQKQSQKGTDLFQVKNQTPHQRFRTSYKQDYIDATKQQVKSPDINLHGNGTVDQKIGQIMDRQTQSFKTRAHKFRNILAFGDQKMGTGDRKKRQSNFRENTPFATTYNNQFWNKGRFSVRERGKKDFQTTNFRLGNYEMDYKTMNKENFKGIQNQGVLKVAGKKRIEKSNIGRLFGAKDAQMKTDYEVFINQKGNKLNVI